MVISYGDFIENKKLFSYEYNGVHTLPIFTDILKAHAFATAVNETDIEPKLMVQLCNDAKNAYQMFGVISVYSDIQQVVINSTAPVRNDNLLEPTKFDLVCEVKQLDEIMNALHDRCHPKTP